MFNTFKVGDLIKIKIGFTTTDLTQTFLIPGRCGIVIENKDVNGLITIFLFDKNRKYYVRSDEIEKIDIDK